MKLLTLVVTYNAEPWYQRCFNSLRASTVPTDVMVVDNASTDRTVALLASEFPGIHVYRSDTNLGFGKANNIGLRHALENAYDYVFLLNQDAWVAEDCLARLIAAHKNNPAIGIASPLHLRGDGLALDSRFLRYYVAAAEALIEDMLLARKLQVSYAAPFVNAAFWLLPRKTLETVGGFDPLFPHYGEDVDYVNRVQFHGLQVHIVPGTTACHDRPQEINAQADRNSERGRFNGTLITLLDPNEQLNITRRMLLGTLARAIFSELAKHSHESLLKRLGLVGKTWQFCCKHRQQIMAHRAMNTLSGATFLMGDAAVTIKEP